jgi:hypothetical protein
MDGLAERDPIHAHRYYIPAGVTTGTRVGDLVKQFQDCATVDVPGKVGSVGGHQHRHCELVVSQVHLVLLAACSSNIGVDAFVNV